MSKISIALIISLALAAVAQAKVIYSNDFDDEDLGGATSPFVRSGKPEVYMNVVARDGSFPTQHLELGSRTDNYAFGFCYFDGGKIDPAVTFPAMVCFKFDMAINEAGTLRMAPRNTDGSSVAQFDLKESESLTVNTVHAIEIFVNNSTSSQKTIYGILAAGSYTAYSDGVLVSGEANKLAANNLGVSYITMWLGGDSDSSTQGVVKIDNWEVNDAVPVRTLSLVGFH